MQLILLKDVKGLGKAGQVVKASDGYARNLLIPKGMAMEATTANIRALEKKNAELAAKKAAEKAEAEAVKAKLENAAIEIVTKAGEGGRLFGAITTKDISEVLEKKYGVEVDKKKIELDAPIKNVGTAEATLKLFTGVTAVCKVIIKAAE